MLFSFGAGDCIGYRNDISNGTPVRFGAFQEIGMDFSFNVKEAYGTYQFPLAIARGTGKIGGTMKSVTISGTAWNALYFGQTLAAGQLDASLGEAATIPTTPYQVTVANSANFVTDLGVVLAAGLIPLTKVASGPTTGQYSVSAGVYTFAAADTGVAVLISYAWTRASVGQKLVIANQILGTTPTFSLNFQTIYQSKRVNIVFNNCTAAKLAFPTKLEDFVMPALDYSMFADSSNNIGTISFSEDY